MSNSLPEVNEANYAAEVDGSPIPVVIDFWAPWCGPCLALMPAVAAVAGMYEGKIKVVKINVDENRAIAEKFGVRGIPYLAVVKQGVVTGQLKEHTRTRLAIAFDDILAQDA